MEINFDSAAAVPIINVPAKKVSPQGTSLTREMVYHSLDIPWFTPTQVGQVSQEISPSPKCSPGHISYEIWPHGSISGNLAASYDTYKNLSIFHESVSIMNTLDKST